MAETAIALSVSAFLFTLVSFWYLHARRGRLVAAAPFTWAGYSKEDGNARIRLPLAMANSGPVGLIVADLRATVTGDSLNARLPWCTERATLYPKHEEESDFAAPIVINGRGVVRHFIEFGGHGADPLSMTPSAIYEVRVEGLVGWATARQA